MKKFIKIVMIMFLLVLKEAMQQIIPNFIKK